MLNSFFNKIFILILAIAFSFLSCSKKDDTAPAPVDKTVEIFDKVSTQNFTMDTSQFKMTGPNNFTFLYDTLITIQQNVRANCVVEISGTATYLESNSSEFKYQALFDVVDATVISAKHFSTTTNDPMLVCNTFTTALKNQIHFEQKVYDLTPNYVAFAKLDFSMPSSDLMKYIYSDTNHTRVSDFGIRHNNELREYFLKDGTSVDLTKASLAETAGNYKMTDTRYVSLQLIVTEEGLSFSSSDCNFKYDFKVKSAYTDTKSFWYELNLINRTPTNSDTANCKIWDANINNLSSRRLEWGYSVKLSYQRNAIFMRFPSQDAGYDRIEAFTP